MIKVVQMFVLFAGFWAVSADAAKIPCKIKLPYITEGCQEDGCKVVYQIVFDRETQLVKDIQSKEIVQKVALGTKVKKPFEFAIEVKRPGIYRTLDQSFDLANEKYRLRKGVLFEVFYYAGAGHYAVCVEDKIEKVQLKNDAEALDPAKTQEWIKVKLDTKTSGFVKRNEVRIISAE
jgi:hypothetical protein